MLDTLEKRWAWSLASRAKQELKNDPKLTITMRCMSMEEVAEVYRPIFRQVLGDQLLKRVEFKTPRKEWNM